MHLCSIFRLFILLLFSTAITAGNISSEKKCLDGTWKISVKKSHKRYSISEVEASNLWKRDINTNDWKSVNVPKNLPRVFPELYPDRKKAHSAFKIGMFSQNTYVSGWYRHSFSVPENWTNKQIFLSFKHVAWECIVWVNGIKVGTHHGSDTGFMLDVSKAVELGKENQLAVWFGSDFGENPPRHCYGSVFTPNHINCGIVGTVNLVSKPTIFVETALIDPELDKKKCRVRVYLWNTLDNTATVRLKLSWKGNDESTFSGSKTGDTVNLASGLVKEPLTLEFDSSTLKTWSPDHPNLSTLKIDILDSEQKLIASKNIRFGYRSFEAKNRKFFLNGKRIRLYMGNIWIRGRYRPLTQNEIDTFRNWIRYQKSMGANAVRHHMAGSVDDELHNIMDEEGLLLIGEWGWFHRVECAIEDPAARQEFLNNTIPEMREWIRNDYNHPSLVIWSLANEFWEGAGCVDLLHPTFDALKPLLGDGRPIITSSGWPSIARGIPLKEDILDFHEYSVGSRLTPSLSWKIFNKDFADLKKVYGNYQQPVTSIETLCLTPDKMPTAFKKISPRPTAKTLTFDQFMLLAKAGFGRDIGVRNMLDKKKGQQLRAEKMIKEVMEQYRLDTRWQGFQPWSELDYPKRRAWLPDCLKAIYSPITAISPYSDRHAYTGRTIKVPAYILKDPLRNATLKLHINLVDAHGKTYPLSETIVNMPTEQELQKVEPSAKIPANLAKNVYTLNFTVSENNKIHAVNSYPINIWPEMQDQAQSNTQKVALLEPENTIHSLAKILATEKISFLSIADNISSLNQFKILFISSADSNIMNLLSDHANMIANWLDNGGRMFCFNLTAACTSDALEIPFLPGLTILNSDQTKCQFVDLARPSHPLFKDMQAQDFENWNGNYHLVTQTALTPLTRNALAVAQTYLKPSVLSALFAARIGKGEVVFSQLDSLSRYNQDPAATQFTKNMLHYALSDSISPLTMPLEKIETHPIKNYLKTVPEELTQTIDLRNCVNRSFTDDGTNPLGWMGGGRTDLHFIPTGRQLFQNIPFDIIDPQNNSGKSCLIMKGGRTKDFPEKVSIPFNNKAARLFFLHTGYYLSPTDVMRYIINYQDGSSETVTVKGNRDIGDWFSPVDRPGCIVGWSAENPVVGHPFGVYLMPWQNPSPDKIISTINVESCTKTTPILLAITAMTKENNWPEQIGKNAWDMSEKNDINKHGRPKTCSFENGILTWTSDSKHSWFDLETNGNIIDCRTYNTLKLRAFVDKPGKLYVHYFSPNNDWGFSKKIILSPGWKTYTLDLKHPFKIGSKTLNSKRWGGSQHQASRLRLDMELDGEFKLDWVTLTPTNISTNKTKKNSPSEQTGAEIL